MKNKVFGEKNEPEMSKSAALLGAAVMPSFQSKEPSHSKMFQNSKMMTKSLTDPHQRDILPVTKQ